MNYLSINELLENLTILLKNEEEYINFPTEDEIYNKMINIDSYNTASPDNRHISNTSNGYQGEHSWCIGLYIHM